jgi:kynurenine formamidase
MKRFFLAAVLVSLAVAALAGMVQFGRVAAQSKPEPAKHPSVTIEQVNRWETELSNWGRWGKDDERGALNLITPQKEVQAARLVKEGVTVSLAHFADLQKAADNFNFGPTKHEMFHNPETGKIGGALDIISFGIHDGTNSHLDALCHYRLNRDGKLLVFNGHPQDLDEDGCKANAIDRMGPGIFTRGILVDLPLLRGVPYLEPGTPIYVSDLEAWEKFAGVKIGAGDVLLVRTGRWARRAKLGPWNAAREAAGLDASVAPWLKQRDISVLGSDGVNDVQPSGVVGAGEAANRPIHTLAIAVLGVPLVDNAYLEDVAREAAARKRWEFLVTAQFTRVPGGTATSFNALATF